MLTFSRLCFLLIFGYVDSSFAQLLLRPLMSQTTRLSSPFPIHLYSCTILFRFLRLLVLVFTSRVYIQVGDGLRPHLQSTLQPP